MMKRILAAALACALALTPLAAFAQEDLEALKLDEDLPEAVLVSSLSGDSIPAKSSILIEQETGQVLHEKNADEPLPPASVTKIMTLLLVMEALEGNRITLEDMVSVSANAASMGGSQIWLKEGEQMSVDDLLKAVSIASANDASVALAEHVAGSEEAFIDLMNARAEELGMENTHFLNCTGLDEEGHITTSRDISLMSRELIRHELVSNYSTIWMDSLRGGETQLVNTNKLVRFYEGATGLKTGTTSGAGSCLSATATRGGLSLVAVVMGCSTSDERFASARGLLDYGFANYTRATPPSLDSQLHPVRVLRGVSEQVEVAYDQPGGFVVEKQLEDSITQEVTLADDVEAPVAAGQILGKAEILVGGQVVLQYDLKAAEAVDRMTYGRAFQALVLALFQVGGRASPPERVGMIPEAYEEAAPEGAADSAPVPEGAGSGGETAEDAGTGIGPVENAAGSPEDSPEAAVEDAVEEDPADGTAEEAA